MTTDPFALLSDLERQFDRAQQGAASRNGWLPAADVIAGEHEVRVLMDAPGVRREDLSIEIHDGNLIVAGERRPVDVTGSSAQRIERGWGRWSRTMRLRDGLDADGITASLADGVLTVTIPVAEQAKPRRIKIDTGQPAELAATT
ncbi:MAG: Hsp20/alpha crystallin family protein [Solirubrobacteraceae bacterium]|nr:Hsp20/alpha crystallin family protein [Solirubrobacteraceae bacterium]